MTVTQLLAQWQEERTGVKGMWPLSAWGVGSIPGQGTREGPEVPCGQEEKVL